MSKSKGFTVLEVCIITIIISLVTLLIINMYQIIIDKIEFSAAKNHLATLQRQIWIYYSLEGNYPDSLITLVKKGYIKEIPTLKVKYHPPTKNVIVSDQPYDEKTDLGIWYYDYKNGIVKIACTHKDLEGVELYKW
ncbi:MAG: hypothetical protein RMJ67_02535 [Elusimicrobiota bacterium]|nr:hypothetical protein [Endomicrobiia bacterium]MDW8165374.1 hypothetical protein [Elusimicrobiota bacterium]